MGLASSRSSKSKDPGGLAAQIRALSTAGGGLEVGSSKRGMQWLLTLNGNPGDTKRDPVKT